MKNQAVKNVPMANSTTVKRGKTAGFAGVSAPGLELQCAGTGRDAALPPKNHV